MLCLWSQMLQQKVQVVVGVLRWLVLMSWIGIKVEVEVEEVEAALQYSVSRPLLLDKIRVEGVDGP